MVISIRIMIFVCMTAMAVSEWNQLKDETLRQGKGPTGTGSPSTPLALDSALYDSTRWHTSCVQEHERMSSSALCCQIRGMPSYVAHTLRRQEGCNAAMAQWGHHRASSTLVASANGASKGPPCYVLAVRLPCEEACMQKLMQAGHTWCPKRL